MEKYNENFLKCKLSHLFNIMCKLFNNPGFLYKDNRCIALSHFACFAINKYIKKFPYSKSKM